ncbi:MAG: NfeD family protein [Deltaproteobacteria bacterium]|jgi:membrane protein implicated in regulation of membrane protease activity|nr:NfeD family protein [Deltaproteobacteria bacterium]
MSLFGSEVLFWFVLGFVLLILEIATPGIVFVFFGLGAWLVMGLLFLFPLSQFFQFLIFIVTSVIFLFLLRRHLKNIFYKNKLEKRVDSLSEGMIASNYLGREVDVIQDINPGYPGVVELNGTNWTARCDETLVAGQRAKVLDIVGLVITVAKINELAPAKPTEPNDPKP